MRAKSSCDTRPLAATLPVCSLSVFTTTVAVEADIRTVEQRVPGWFSFDEDSSQQGYQEQDQGSNSYNCPGAARTRTGGQSLININTLVPGSSWLLNTVTPSSASACSQVLWS